jgi:hypothetical protein
LRLRLESRCSNRQRAARKLANGSTNRAEDPKASTRRISRSPTSESGHADRASGRVASPGQRDRFMERPRVGSCAAAAVARIGRREPSFGTYQLTSVWGDSKTQSCHPKMDRYMPAGWSFGLVVTGHGVTRRGELRAAPKTRPRAPSASPTSASFVSWFTLVDHQEG